jgi:hypothetical protein
MVQYGSFLEPIDRIMLALSSHGFYSMRNRCEFILASSLEGRRGRVRIRLCRDWSRRPAYQVCILCCKKHPRFQAQNTVHRRQTEFYHDGRSSCAGGLRLTADTMMCHVCLRKLAEDVDEETR